MKSTEFGAVNEGVMSTIGQGIKSGLARSGALGKTRQINAMNDRANDMAYKTGLSSFSKLLSNTLTRSYNSGLIGPSTTTTATPAPAGQQAAAPTAPTTQTEPAGKAPTTTVGKVNPGAPTPGEQKVLQQKIDAALAKSKVAEDFECDFDQFDSLLESVILNEAQGISDFISDFITAQAENDKFVIPQKMASTLNSLSDQLEASFLKTGGKTIDQNIVRKLWDLYYTAGLMGNKKSRTTDQGSTSQQAMDPASQQAQTEREQWKRKIIDKLLKLDLDDPESINVLKSITSELLAYINKIAQK